jgi:hypothetical protein
MLTRNSSFSLTKTKKVDRLFIRLQSKLSSDLETRGTFYLVQTFFVMLLNVIC